MKKLISLSIILTLIIAGCTDTDDVIPTDIPQMELTSKNRTVGDAIKIANQLLTADSQTQSRSGITPKSISDVHIITDMQSRSGSADTLFYALDIEDEGGFYIIAAPKTIDPVFAIVDEGSFNDPDNLDNKPYQYQLEQIKNYISSGIGGVIDEPRIPIDLRPYEYWDTIDINQRIDPIVQVTWNQSWPENIYAPNKVAGCVPIAIAQLLSAIELPPKMYYSFENKDIPSETIDWREIKKHKRSMKTLTDSDFDTNYYCTDCSLGQANYTHQTIGRIVREIGEIAEADYKSYIIDGELVRLTNASASKIASTIQYLTGRNYTSSGNSISSAFYNICNQKGIAIVWSDSHAWIADGIINIRNEITYYEFDPLINDYHSTTIKNIQTKLIHYNWGWGGNCNGFFRLTELRPANATIFDYPDEFNYSTADYTERGYIFYKL